MNLKFKYGEEWYCENYHCKDCKYFKFVMPNDHNSGCQRRIDHHHLVYGASCFCDVPEEMPFPCNEFEPSKINVYGNVEWHGYNDWLDHYEKYWNEGKPIEGLMRLYIDGDKSVDYHIKITDWINGTLYDENGNPKWVDRRYLKRTRNGFGYKRIIEKYKNGEWIPYEQ